MAEKYTLEEILAVVHRAHENHQPVPKFVIKWLSERQKAFQFQAAQVSEEERQLHKEFVAELQEEERARELEEIREEDDIDIVAKPPEPVVKIQPGPTVDDLALESMVLVITTTGKGAEVLLHAGDELRNKVAEVVDVNPDFRPALMELFGAHAQKPEFASRLELAKEDGDIALRLPVSDVPAFTTHFQDRGFDVKVSPSVARMLNPTPQPSGKKMEDEEVSEAKQDASLYKTPKPYSE